MPPLPTNRSTTKRSENTSPAVSRSDATRRPPARTLPLLRGGTSRRSRLSVVGVAQVHPRTRGLPSYPEGPHRGGGEAGAISGAQATAPARDPSLAAVVPWCYRMVMSVRKFSVALDESVAASASRAAQTAGVSLSAWLSRAAVHELALERGRRAVVAWEREHGALTGKELRDADTLLDELLSTRPRKSRAKRAARKA